MSIHRWRRELWRCTCSTGLTRRFDNIIYNVIKHQKPFLTFEEAKSMLEMEEDRLKKAHKVSATHSDHASSSTGLVASIWNKNRFSLRNNLSSTILVVIMVTVEIAMDEEDSTTTINNTSDNPTWIGGLLFIGLAHLTTGKPNNCGSRNPHN